MLLNAKGRTGRKWLQSWDEYSHGSLKIISHELSKRPAMREPIHLRKFWPAFCATVIVLGCAPIIPTRPATIEPQPGSVPSHTVKLLASAEIALDTGYFRTLADKSIWRPVGRLPQGTVYRPVGTIFTIEGRQVHEAYLVIRDSKLVGFYLPGEQNYSPMSNAVPLNLGENE
jgi:hypothetical protein